MRLTLPRIFGIAIALAMCCTNQNVLVVTSSAQSRGAAPTTRPPAPGLVFAFELRATVAAPTELGQVAAGRRRIVDITGGTFEGPGIKGKIRPGGADWQIVRADGFTELDTRYTIETDKGQLIYVQTQGCAMHRLTSCRSCWPDSRSIRRSSTSGRCRSSKRPLQSCSG
jgi:hypothetical protein